MTGSLSSLNTALTALRYHRVAMDVASNNVANVATEGYTRRRVEAESIGAPNVPATWSTYDGAGGGVRTSGITRIADTLLDTRSRQENASLAELSARATSLARLESGVGEPGDSGVNAALAAFRSAWQDLANDPGSTAARNQVIAQGQSVAQALAGQSANVQGELATQRAAVLGALDEVNTVAAELAATNEAISSSRLDGVDVSDLLDQRDLLAHQLAELGGGEVTYRADGGVDVSVGGELLVSGAFAGRVELTSGITPTGGADGAPIALAVTLTTPSGTTTSAVSGDVGGRLGAAVSLVDGDLASYAAGLDAVAVGIADAVNAVHAAGYDLDGATGRDFFTYTAGAAASTLSVAVTAREVAASDVAGGALDGSTADRIGTARDAEAAYQSLVSGLGTDVASAARLSRTQGLLAGQVDSAREQLSGVNLDEEMVSMLTAQRAYEAAARVMTVMDSVLDTLINRTGVTR